MRATLIRRLPPEELSPIVEWMAALPLQEVTKSSYVNGRTEKWFRAGSNLQSPDGGRGRVFRCEEPPDFVVALGDRQLPGWHSLLVCGGRTSIGLHSDHQHFERQAVMLNVGWAEFSEHGRQSSTITLEDALYLLDTGVQHSSLQLAPIRFHATFRRICPRFLGQL